jgi:hypothetical protein
MMIPHSDHITEVTMIEESAYACPSCQIGYCHPAKGTYLRLVGDMLVSAPETPLWKCDICEYEEFDREAVMRLEALLGQYESVPDTGRFNPKLPSLDASDSTTPRRAKP